MTGGAVIFKVPSRSRIQSSVFQSEEWVPGAPPMAKCYPHTPPQRTLTHWCPFNTHGLLRECRTSHLSATVLLPSLQHVLISLLHEVWKGLRHWAWAAAGFGKNSINTVSFSFSWLLLPPTYDIDSSDRKFSLKSTSTQSIISK